MVKKVTFSKRARSKIYQIVSYLKKDWSQAIAETSVILLYKKFENRPEVRKCKITKQVTLYYKVKSNKIEIITLFDSRQNPDKLRL